jgi:hypothetical protein
MRPRRRVSLRHRRRERYRRSLASPLVTLPFSGLFLRTAWRNSANGGVRNGRKAWTALPAQGCAVTSWDGPMIVTRRIAVRKK